MDLPSIKKHAHLLEQKTYVLSSVKTLTKTVLQVIKTGVRVPVVSAGHGAEGRINGAAYLRGGAVGDILLKHEGDVFTGGPQPAQHAVVFEVARKFGDDSARVKRVRRHAVRCGAEQKKNNT